MVLMDIRERIGRVEFEFLVEKKLGTENKDNLIMWLMDLFPPESTDPSLQQVPEPQALPEESYGSGTPCSLSRTCVLGKKFTTSTQTGRLLSTAHPGSARF